MTFNLIFFICFSLFAIFTYHAWAKNYSNTYLLFISIVFYSLVDFRHALLLVGSIIVTYYLVEMANAVGGKKKKIISGMAILFVILMLSFYKFFPSIMDGYDFASDILMPIGISYFSFKMISYVIDCGMKEKQERSYSLLEYAVYVSLFSQIVSGPIARISDFEFGKAYNRISRDEVRANVRLIISGMFKKLVIAERLAIYTDYCFNNYRSIPTIALWMNVVFYSIRLYCDFCGYSEIAIGITRMFGLYCRDNFCRPYFSMTIKEFWNRWHISLSHWLRDYIYIPLGGSRSGKWQKLRNTIITFTVSGIWHGNSWNYIVWGVWHGIFQILSPKKECLKHWLGKFFCYIGTLLVIAIGWIFFYYRDIKNAFNYIGNMWKGFDISINSIIASVMPFTQDYACFAHFGIVCMMIGILFLYEWMRNRNMCYAYRLEMYIYVVSIILFGVFGQNSFIYANF